MSSSIHNVFQLASTLFDFRWSAHAIWFVGWMGFAVVILIGVVEFFSWLRERYWNRLRGVPDAEFDPYGFQVRDPDSELRQRYYTDPPKISRDHRSNEPAKPIERR